MMPQALSHRCRETDSLRGARPTLSLVRVLLVYDTVSRLTVIQNEDCLSPIMYATCTTGLAVEGGRSPASMPNRFGGTEHREKVAGIATVAYLVTSPPHVS